MKLEFSRHFLKNTQISCLIKIRLVEAEFFHADRRTDGRIDMTKLTVAFRNFANATNENHKEVLKGNSDTQLYSTVIPRLTSDPANEFFG